MKKYKKAYLHFGPDKTGSTAIQTVFDRNRELMSSLGIHYPAGNWHAELGSCFCDAPEKYIFNVLSGFIDRKKIQESSRTYLSRFREELEQSLSDVLVLSYEGFVDLDKMSLLRFRDFIAEYATTCEVVFYARSPLSYAASALSQRVKTGLPSWPAGDTPVMPSRVFLERLVSVFGKEQLNVRKFARDALPNGDVALDFLSLLNLPDSECHALVEGIARENSALSAEALLIGERMIGLLKGSVALGDPFFGKFADMLSAIKGEKIRLSLQQISEVIQASKIHSDYLAAEFGISFADEANEAECSLPLLSPRTTDSLAELLLGFILPKMRINKEINSSDLTLISAALRQDKVVMHGQLMTFDVDFFLSRDVQNLEMGIHLFDSDRQWAFGTNSTLLGQSHQSLPSASYRVSHHLIADLPAGKYTAGFAFAERLPEGRQRELAWREVMCEFQITHHVSKTFAGYSYLPAAISLNPTS
jgi:hypothetical protein